MAMQHLRYIAHILVAIYWGNLSWLNFDGNSRNIYLLPHLKIGQYHENGNLYQGWARIGPSHYVHTKCLLAHIGIGENFPIYIMRMEIGLMARPGLESLHPSHYTNHFEL